MSVVKGKRMISTLLFAAAAERLQVIVHGRRQSRKTSVLDAHEVELD